ncbi:hypothetical protein I3760_03G116900 [Carya illinoinensis]|nr:hypothetical protein I3760_03G116900 [Carya illinoinensis]
MSEISTLPENPGTFAAVDRGNEECAVSALVSVPSGDEERVGSEEGDRNWSGSRWSRQESLALLEIRSDMDDTFRDSATKAPLWEAVSRKLAELGYTRSAKKCKEKFENIYKYHKRTKEVRSGRSNGKNYRFFEQLEALDSNPQLASPSPYPEKVQASLKETGGIVANTAEPTSSIQNSVQHSIIFADNTTPSTSSSLKELEGMGKKKKKKLTEYFEGLMKVVVEKQENLQRKLIEALDKCEQDRMAREEAWRMEELDRIKREREILVQERSITAAKDAAVLAFLKQFSEQASSVQLPQESAMVSIPVEKVVEGQDNSHGGDVMGQVKHNGGNVLDNQEDNSCVYNLEKQENDNRGNSIQKSSARWPKDEVDALIRLRTNLDYQYQENGPKASLWEEISMAMKKIGYDRSAKRCKEKWENINKYFKRVKESNKKRPEDSKTCPYFHQLDALYTGKTAKVEKSTNSGNELKPEELLMHIMNGQEEQQRTESVTEGSDGENADQIQVDKEDEDADGYQVVASDPSSMATVG